MNVKELIEKKKLGEALNENEINFIINGCTNRTIPDYQLSALLMAIYFQGMSKNEVSNLTQSMATSGDIKSFPFLTDKVIDKHSTGGVGDKVSLIVAPLVASLGIPIIKMSGRGLGHTGGTLDKLESIEGFKTELSDQELLSSIKKCNLAIIGQSENIAPADKRIYEVRDVTGTVDSLPLIASSIMSKKIALGADGIVIDVKVGNGAFMQSVNEARELSKIMIEIGKNLGKEVVCLITSMNQPLGKEIGNINEVQESVNFLKGDFTSNNLRDVVIEVSIQMAKLSNLYRNVDTSEIKKLLYKNINEGKAFEKFSQMVSCQGGSMVNLFKTERPCKYIVKSEGNGYIDAIDTRKLGYLALELGAGRKSIGDAIDHNAGITMNIGLGDKIREGDVLFKAYTNKPYSSHLEDEMKKVINIRPERRTQYDEAIIDIIKL